MNEVEEVNTPVETETDVWGFDLEAEETAEVEDTETETEEEEVATETETVEDTDYTPLLNKLSENLKHLDDEIKIDDLDKAKELLQKGLDYDRIKGKKEELENSEELKWIKSKAQENNMTPQEYMKAVKDFEAEQERLKEEAKLNELLDNGIPEDIAREVIETGKVRRELEQKNKELELAKQAEEKAKARELDNEQFVQAYPDVDVASIPKEVLIEAETIGMIPAYAKYENVLLKKELEVQKQNNKNKSTSPNVGTTTHGSQDDKVDPQEEIWKQDYVY